MAAEDIKAEQPEPKADEVLEPEVVEAEPAEEPQEEQTQAEPVDELAQAKAEAAELRDQYLRLQAEWDNYRKRTAAERESEKVRASEKLVKDLIPVVDDLERALEHAQQAGDGGSLTAGVEAVTNKFLQILSKHKVEQIKAEGEPFDPMKHQAVGTQPDPTVPEETVVNVYQKGYQMGDRVLRPAMVVTSTK
ncbi:MAG: nucleotide exchange factor GrpE [Coriobacteriales bacterium]